MVLWLIRVAFILVLFGVGFAAVSDKARPLGDDTWLLMAVSITMGVFVIVGDYLAPRRKLQLFAGTFFGLLVGIVLAYALSFITPAIVEQFIAPAFGSISSEAQRDRLTHYIDLAAYAICCYLAVSLVLQTKDDFRFIIPYFDFSKQTKGNRPLILDTSALIDGRIADVAATGVFDTQLIVPRFVLDELQLVADSGDRLKRNRGRRGLVVVERLKKDQRVNLAVHEAGYLEDEQHRGVDALVMRLATELDARVVTTDFNLNKVAGVSGVDVINLNDLANAVKGAALPGETMRVHIARPGEGAHQGVGFMDDGTMVVVEHARPFVGEDVAFVVTNTRQTNAGKMIFGRLLDEADVGDDEPSEGDDDARDDRPAPAAEEPPADPPGARDGHKVLDVPKLRNGPGKRGGLGRPPRRGDSHG